jgi:hypothetical protein
MRKEYQMSIPNFFLKDYNLELCGSPRVHVTSNVHTVYNLPVTNPDTLLKTGDLKIDHANQEKQCWMVRLEEKSDIDSVLRIDEQVKEYLKTNLSTFTDNEYDDSEIDVMLIPSLNGDTMKLSNVEGKKITVFDPFKLIISNERLVKNVIIRAAIKPWKIEFMPRIMRFRILWHFVQAMVVDEPDYSECVLESEN